MRYSTRYTGLHCIQVYYKSRATNGAAEGNIFPPLIPVANKTHYTTFTLLCCRTDAYDRFRLTDSCVCNNVQCSPLFVTLVLCVVLLGLGF